MADQRHFEVVVDGQYRALHESGSQTLKRYTSKFILPSQEAALSVICKHLLSAYLQKNYSDYINFRTHELKSITVIGRQPNPEVLQMGIDEMTKDQLWDFCILRQIMIDPNKHDNLGKCKEIVMNTWRTMRQVAADKQSSKESTSEKEAEMLRKANKLPPKSDGVQININAQKAAAANIRNSDSEKSLPGNIESDEPLPPIENDNGINSEIT